MLSERRFRIEFTPSKVEGDDYFVPYYARKRRAGQRILSGVYYEPLTHRLVHEIQRIRPGSMFHAGTSFGDMLPSFSRACAGTLYAFEPVLENYVMAKLCVQKNGLDDVILLNAALGSEISMGYMDVTLGDGAHRGGTSQLAAQGQPTAILTIDQFGLEEVSLIQLDVEGHELEALLGAKQTIARCRPYILIEDNLDNCAEFLTQLDYHCIGEIPNLTFWVHEAEKGQLSEIIANMSQSAGADVRIDIPSGGPG